MIKKSPFWKKIDIRNVSLLLCIIGLFLGAQITYAQSNSHLQNILIAGGYEGKNMHDLLMDLNSSGQIFIAYDVNELKSMALTSNPDGQNLQTVLNNSIGADNYQLEEHRNHTFLLRCEKPVDSFIQNENNNKLTIQGQLLDEDGLKLPYGYIVSPNLRFGIYADENGAFEMAIPQSALPLTLCAGSLGYEQKCIRVDRHNTTLQYQLSNQKNLLDIITIKDMAIPLIVKENAFTIRYSNRFNLSSPGGNDPLRKTVILPSVQMQNDLSASIRIRNAQSDETAIYYDDIPLFSSYHYAGFISNINPSTVQEVNVYPMTIPIDYSNNSGGMIQILSTSDQKLDWDNQLGINLLYGSGKLAYSNDRHAFQLAGRTNFSTISNNSFYSLTQEEKYTTFNKDGSRKTLIPINPDYGFSDINLMYAWKVTDNWRLKLTHIRSKDNALSTVNADFNPRRNMRDSLLRESQTETETIAFQGSSVALEGAINQNWDVALSLARSLWNYTDSSSISVQNITRHMGNINREFYNVNNDISWSTAKLRFIYSPDNAGQFVLGYNFTQYTTGISYEFVRQVDFNSLRYKKEHHLFSSWSKSIGNLFDLNVGANLSYDYSKDPLFLSSRISLSRQITEKIKIRGEFAQYQQRLRKLYHENPYGKSFEFWTISNDKNIPDINATGYDLNVEYKSSNTLITSGIFYRTSDGLLAWKSPKPGTRMHPSRIRKKIEYIYYRGEGKSYGFEAMSYFQLKPFQLLVSYQWSKSLVSYPKILDGTWQFAENDRRHRLSAILNYQFKKWTFETSYHFMNGKPYLDLSKISEETQRNDQNFEDVYSYLPNYHRIDASARYDFKVRGIDFSTKLEINNVFDHVNTYYQQYQFNPDVNNSGQVAGTSYNQLGRYFNVGVDLYFNR